MAYPVHVYCPPVIRTVLCVCSVKLNLHSCHEYEAKRRNKEGRKVAKVRLNPWHATWLGPFPCFVGIVITSGDQRVSNSIFLSWETKAYLITLSKEHVYLVIFDIYLYCDRIFQYHNFRCHEHRILFEKIVLGECLPPKVMYPGVCRVLIASVISVYSTSNALSIAHQHDA